ncbi:CHAT domain-containing protein [Streptomyces sp. NPDC088251]|uniref:CHAT domain-containing protein n=1 Tax=unclassified Streptomyces TaxID=2593676 RepID=UPI0037F90CEF
MTAATAMPAPPEPVPGAGPLELLDLAEQLLEHHDEQERPEDAARSWNRCRAVLLRARDALERQGAVADPYALARARFLLGLTLSVGYWQAATGQAEPYGIDAPYALRQAAAPLLALSRATLPDDDPMYATACVRHGLLLHDRHENPDPDDAPAPSASATPAPAPAPGAPATPDPAPDSTPDPDGTPSPDTLAAPDPGSTPLPKTHDDLDEALAAFQEGLRLLGGEAHPGLLVTYACALGDRYVRDRDADDLRDSAGALEELLAEIRPPGWAPAADGTGSWADEADQLELETRVQLVRLLQESPEAADAERAVHHLELLAATAPDEHPARVFASGHLVDVYRERGGGRALPEDRPAYLARLRDLHRLIDHDDPDHARVAAILGAALAERTGPADPAGPVPSPQQAEAIGLLREALAGLSDEDDRRPPSHALLGSLLNALHDREPERYDVREAAFHLERAVELHPADDPLRSDLLNQLAHAGLADDGPGADLEGIDRTIALLNESMLKPSDSPGFGSEVHGTYASALSRRHALSHSSDDLDASIRHLTAAFRQTPADNVNRIVYLQNLSLALYQRYLAGGDLQDLQTAHRYLHEVNTALDNGASVASADLRVVERDRPALEQGLAQLQFMVALTFRNKEGMAAAVAAMRRLRDSLAPDDPLRLPVEADYGLLLLIHSYNGGTPQDRVDGLLLMIETVEALPEEHQERPRLLLRTAGALLMTSYVPYNPSGIEGAERMLREALALVSPDSQEGLRSNAMYATLLLVRFRHAGVPADADLAVDVARAARERIRDRAPSPVSTLLGNVLADALRARSAPGDGAAARRAGIAALREAATVVLLQAAAESALQMARTAADRALQIARWCLADGDLGGAVEALELGRGQVLHASTTTSDVAALLREAGRADLAEEWEGGAGGRAAPAVTGFGTPLDGPGSPDGPGSLLGTLGPGVEPPLPDDLRQRALTALARSDAGTALTTAPTPDGIAATLRAAGAHALVYLLPPGGAELLPAGVGNSGSAVVVTRDGRVGTVGFGLLRRQSLDVLETYRAAHRHRQAALDLLPAENPEHLDAHVRWRTALEELCDWAGPVVMGPLSRSPLISEAGPAPHLVLVPFGDLGGIPWHAALLSSGLRDGGRPVHAVERLTLSYAASARQFQEAHNRPRPALDAHPVIVGNPDDTLPGAAAEARQIHTALYPRGLLLGKVRRANGPGSPAEVLAALPGRERAGASVLHLACHARPSSASPLDAHLLLAAPDGGSGREDAGHLSIREILRQARGRPPGAPGGLVVLDACVSDHAGDDLDEALTLSTAFLAAGATGVVGSRWEVPDGPTGLVMYVFHDRLRRGATPVRALREAQLWLLDPDREVPEDMPRAVADILYDVDPAALELWAAFACQGR